MDGFGWGSFVGAGLMLFWFFDLKSLFMDEYGCLFNVFHLEFDSLWLYMEQCKAGFMLFLQFSGKNYINYGIFKKFQVQKLLSTGIF